MNIITIISDEKNKKLKKEKVMYIEKRLKELNMEFMEAFVIKEVETVEQHVSLFTCVLLLLLRLILSDIITLLIE